MINRYEVNITKSIKWNIADHISALITGARGSGKSFLLLSLIVMLATLPQKQNDLLGTSMMPTQIFAIDLKNSDVARLRMLLPSNRVAHTKNDALKILERFVDLMKRRLEFIQNETPFGVIIATQQATVTNSGLSTAIQEEVGLKIHMGNATSEAYRLTFGNDLKIPNEYLDVSEGMLWLEGQNLDWATPFAAPYIDTDNFWNILQQALVNQSDEKYLKLCTG